MTSMIDGEPEKTVSEADSIEEPDNEAPQHDSCGSKSMVDECEIVMENENDEKLMDVEKSEMAMNVDQPSTPKPRGTKRQAKKESRPQKGFKQENISEVEGSQDDKSEDEATVVTRRSARRNPRSNKDSDEKAGDISLTNSEPIGQNIEKERKDLNSDEDLLDVGSKHPPRRVSRTNTNRKSSAARTRKTAQANSRGKSNKTSNSLKGKGRRSIFKKIPTKAPSSVARSMTSDRAYYHGQYFTKGDIVSVQDIDGGVYYAQIRGFLTDQFCEKSCVITWLMPTRHSPDPNERFDPATYVIGPEEDLPRKLEFFTFVMHAPDDYYYYKKAPYPTDAIPTDQEYVNMPFKRGVAPIRRTIKFLESGNLVFKDRVKVMMLNYNEKTPDITTTTSFDHHKGLQEFVFWNLPQVQYKNPNIQILTLKNMTPSPFITCFLDKGEKVIFDVDGQTSYEIASRLIKTLGKSEEVLEKEAIAAEKKDNPAIFGPGCQRFCICETPGQVPCPAVVKVPKQWRGKYFYNLANEEEDS